MSRMKEVVALRDETRARDTGVLKCTVTGHSCCSTRAGSRPSGRT